MSDKIKKAALDFFDKVIDQGANMHFAAEKAGIRNYWMANGITLGLYLGTAVLSRKYRLLGIVGLLSRIPVILVSSKLDVEEINRMKSFMNSVVGTQGGNKNIPPTKIN